MNIKDVELKTGMTRANIRYYESLSLISPMRLENGYRDYSDSDIDELLKIKLLRSLDISLEDIGSLSRGEKNMEELLALQIKELEKRENETAAAKELCRALQADNVCYRDLNAHFYLERIGEKPTTVQRIIERDKPPRVTNYALRFFARSFDFFICSAFVNCIFILGGVNITILPQGTRFLLSLLSVAILLFGEPLLLCTWGTTPGKWIMGISLRLYNGEKLPYMDGLSRTFGVICWGYGFFIPIYSIVRLVKSGIACGDDEELRWDDGCIMYQKDEKPLRWLFLALAYLLCFAIILLCSVSAIMPDNRGPMTVEQFVENYNDAVDFDGGSSYLLTSRGTFQEITPPDNSVVINIHGTKMPTFTFYEENGILVGFTINMECSGDEIWPSSCANQIATASQCFIHSVTGKLISKDFDELIDTLNKKPFEDFRFEIRGYELSADYTIDGYHKTGMSYLVPSDTADSHSYSLQFSLFPIK
ncbi:MAG: MerR family transcriptional regulator [Oscillospiraceae bacterium]|nr:MerR family transcriptional regulator [Oscillospiraceae bacterium]